MCCLYRFVHGRAAGKDGEVSALVSVGRSDEADGAVLMLVVVPFDEIRDPSLCGISTDARAPGNPGR